MKPARQGARTTKPHPKFFRTPADFRKWMEQHHADHDELWVGYYKKDSGKPSMTWPESVDVALCFGWIDGVRKSIDAESYTNRFTPRRPGSAWSAINIARVGELTKVGLMHPAGLKAFENAEDRRNYSYEQRKSASLGEEYEGRFRSNKKAWEFFQAQTPWYRRTAVWWVMSAKKEETRRKRLTVLIEDSEKQRPIAPLARNPKSKGDSGKI